LYALSLDPKFNTIKKSLFSTFVFVFDVSFFPSYHQVLCHPNFADPAPSAEPSLWGDGNGNISSQAGELPTHAAAGSGSNGHHHQAQGSFLSHMRAKLKPGPLHVHAAESRMVSLFIG
jgi:hypothetical protein